MDILGIMGTMPGQVVASVAHLGTIRQIRMDVSRNPAGGWHARRGTAAWGLRCHSATTAVLLEAGEAWEEMAPAALELAAD
jgi:hypothetical protein